VESPQAAAVEGIVRDPSRLITLEEAARRVLRSKKTLKNWIADGKLRGPQGLVYVAGRPAIDWPLFAVAFVKGDGAARCLPSS